MSETLRVFLVDDDEEDFLLTKSYLQDIPNRKYVLDWTSDFDEALNRICECNYDVYLIDYHLGARNGLDLIRIAQSRGCLEPMILLTGQGELETDLAAMNAGASDYLEKAKLDATILERTIRYACLQKRLESELEAKVQERTRELEQEIQARRRVEEQLREADRRKDEFLGALGHELRNPLMPITNALAILQLTGVPPGPARKAMEILERQVNILVRLIDDLLDVGRITNGKLRLDLQPVQLQDVLRTALEVSQIVLDKARVKWSLEVPAELPTLLADRVRLAQVFTNLLNNAAKYTPEGGEVHLSVREANEEQGQWIIVKVRDTGVGVAPELLTKLFDLFSQETRNLERSRDGLGIGLALVRAFVELHGGKVTAHSEGIGKGTEFTVSLPVRSSMELPEPVV